MASICSSVRLVDELELMTVTICVPIAWYEFDRLVRGLQLPAGMFPHALMPISYSRSAERPACMGLLLLRLHVGDEECFQQRFCCGSTSRESDRQAGFFIMRRGRDGWSGIESPSWQIPHLS